MAKFKVGDKVESVKTGAKGVVDEVYGDEKYAVLFDGATTSDRVEGFQIKAANGCARNAKFKMGDQVLYRGVFGGRREDRIGTIRSEDSPGKYWVVFFDGSKMLVPETSLEAKNACAPRSSNAVVQNAINARRAMNLTLGFEMEPEYKYYKKVFTLRENAISEVEKLEAVASKTAAACKKFFDEWKAQKGSLTQEMNKTTKINADTLIAFPVEDTIRLLKSSIK